MMKHIEAGAWKIVAGALIFSFGFSLLRSIGHHPAPVTTTAVAQPATASARSAPARAATIAPSALVVLWPALIPPSGIKPGRVSYTLAASPWIDFGTWGPEIDLGGATIDASASSFASLPIAGLAADIPTRGRVRETWTWWMQVPSGGAQALVLRMGATAGESASATLTVDTDSTPVVAVTCCGPAIVGGSPQQVGVGQVDLAAGWHKLTLAAVHMPSVGPVSADVFRRGPNDSAPTTILPFFTTAAVPALSPMSAATTPAPLAIPTGGGAHSVPTTTEKKS